MTASGLPMIFILDWDGTIVGRVDFQSHRFALLQALRKSGFTVKTNDRIVPKAFSPPSRLVRPGFVSFIKAMRAHYGDQALFFIYTASDKQWALKEIDWVERSHGIKFQRPIFTREDCVLDKNNVFRKSIATILPRVMRSAAKLVRGSKAFTVAEREFIVQQQFMIIDNNAVYDDFKEQLMVCPDYSYTYFENVLEGIPVSVLESPAIQPFLMSMASMGVLCPVRGTAQADYVESLAQKYAWMAEKCAYISTANKAYQKDGFWKHLKKILIKNNVQAFSPTLVARVQNKIWTAHRSATGSASTSGTSGTKTSST